MQNKEGVIEDGVKSKGGMAEDAAKGGVVGTKQEGFTIDDAQKSQP